MELNFTQYMFPTGEKREVVTDVPDAVYERAQQIIAMGYRFEIEVLANGFVSITISDDDDDYAHRIVPNGPPVPLAVEDLIMSFKLPPVTPKVTKT